MGRGNRVILMMGLPRSGKSTRAGELKIKHGWPIVNRDSIRLALHGQRYAKEAEGMVKTIALVMVNALLLAGNKTIIVDETSIKKATREFWGSGKYGHPWITEVLHIDTSMEVCLERAAETDDTRIVPVIESMARDLEPLEDNEVIFQEPSLETPGKSS